MVQFTAVERDAVFYTSTSKGVPSFNKRYTKGIPFMSEMVYKRSRDWTSGESPPGIKFCSVPLGFSIRQKSSLN